MSAPLGVDVSRVWAFGLAALLVASPIPNGLASEHSAGERTFRAMGVCQECTITDRDLTGQSLFSIDMERASISDTTFKRATLFVANFQGAKLTNVQFDMAIEFDATLD